MSRRPIIRQVETLCRDGQLSGHSLITSRRRSKFNYPRAEFTGVLLILVILWAPICLADRSGQENPHHFQQSCGSCHQLQVRADNPRENVVGPLNLDVEKACSQSGCHEYDRDLNHPVGVQVAGTVPAEMPLNDEGQITCLTCHSELDRADHLPAHLRVAPGRDLCASCHEGSGNSPKARSHWQFTTKAHLGIDGGGPAAGDYHKTLGGIDFESYTCLSCHDCISAVVSRDNESASERRRRRQDMSDHPIGMTYARKALGRGGGFNAFPSIDRRIRLFDGRVGCGSCHSLYNKDKNHLAVSGKWGGLCRQCHIK